MTTAAITTNEYATRLAAVLTRKHGDSRSAAKRLAARVGAGVGTVRKWFAGENGADGVHLIKLIAEDDDVLHVVLEMAGRGDVAGLIALRDRATELRKAMEAAGL